MAINRGNPARLKKSHLRLQSQNALWEQKSIFTRAPLTYENITRGDFYLRGGHITQKKTGGSLLRAWFLKFRFTLILKVNWNFKNQVRTRLPPVFFLVIWPPLSSKSPLGVIFSYLRGALTKIDFCSHAFCDCSRRWDFLSLAGLPLFMAIWPP